MTRRKSNTRVRIIGGAWKRQSFSFPEIEGLRPSMDRVRETLFNWLQTDIAGARCLDLFAGSGVLGLEALSRGAAHVDFIEQHPKAAKAISDHLKRLASLEGGLDEGAYKVKTVDALKWLKNEPSEPYDVIFLDPPFHRDFLQATHQAMASWSGVDEKTIIYVEAEKKINVLQACPQWQFYKSSQAGHTQFFLFQKSLKNPAD